MHSPREQGPSSVTVKGASRKRVENDNTRMPACGTSSGDEGEQNLSLDDMSGLWEPLVPNSRGPRLLGQSRDSAENEFGQTGNLQGMQEHYVTEKVPGHDTSFWACEKYPECKHFMRTMMDADEMEVQDDKASTKQRHKGKTESKVPSCSHAHSVRSCPSPRKGNKNKDAPEDENDMTWEWEAPLA